MVSMIGLLSVLRNTLLHGSYQGDKTIKLNPKIKKIPLNSNNLQYPAHMGLYPHIGLKHENRIKNYTHTRHKLKIYGQSRGYPVI
jgi:hypothetical protein